MVANQWKFQCTDHKISYIHGNNMLDLTVQCCTHMHTHTHTESVEKNDHGLFDTIWQIKLDV